MKSNTQSHWLNLLVTSLGIILISFFTSTAFAKGDVYVNSKGLAIKGYDPVAYFVNAKAQKGKKGITHTHAGNTWRFVNEANKKAFIANPVAYIPQYGGHCAYAASKNSIAPVDPRAWEIRNNKLYLNYSKRIHNKWLPNADANIVKGDANWKHLAKDVKPEKSFF